MHTYKPLSIVLITYNRPAELLELLKNIAGQQQAETLLESVIIINNASTLCYEHIINFIKTQKLPFQYFYSKENLGVARGRNKAISMVRAPVVITLDDDAIFTGSNALITINELFQSAFSKQNRVAVYSFKVFYRDTENLQETAFPHKKIEKYRDKDSFLTYYYIGCGHAILRKAYDLAGLYPDDFFYGMEEYDLGYRILDLGYRISYNSSISIIHNESKHGRINHVEKMQMLWINKSKMAYRYLPYRYFASTAIMWSLEFLKKTSFDWKYWFQGWKTVLLIPRTEKEIH